MKTKVVFGSGGNMFLDFLRAFRESAPGVAIPFATATLFVVVLWHTVNKITPFNVNEVLFSKGGTAYTIQRLSLVVGQAIGMLHIFKYSIHDDGYGVIGWMLLEGAWVFAALLLVRPVVDWVVLRKVRNIDELLKGNKAVGAVEAGFYICAGFALNGSLDGQASSVLKSMESTVVFGVLGLLLVVGVFVFIHERITRFQLRKVLRDGGKRYNLQDEIAQGNLAAAYEVAGMLIGTSMVVREGVAGDFSGWRSGFAGFFATTLVAVIGLYLARWLIDRLVLTNCTVKEILEQNQINAGAVMMALVIVMALFLSTAIRLQL